MAEPNQNQPDPLDNPNEDENAPARGNNNNAHQPGDEEILEMLNALPAEDNPEDEEAILLNALPAEDNPEDEDAILLNALNEDTILDQIEDEPVGIFEESERQRTQTARINRMLSNEPPMLNVEQANLTNMPTEMLAQIFQSLSTTNRLDLEAVCSRWRAISRKHSWCLTKHLQIFPADIVGKRRIRPVELQDRFELQALDARQYFNRLVKWCALYVKEFTITHILEDDKFFRKLYRFGSLSHIMLYRVGYELITTDFKQIAQSLPHLKSLFIIKCCVHYRYWQGIEFLFENCHELEIFFTYLLADWKLGYYNKFLTLPASLKVVQIHGGSVIDWVWWRRIMEIALQRCPRLSALFFRDPMMTHEHSNPNETFQRFAEYNSLVCLDLRHINLLPEHVLMLEPVLPRLRSFTCSKIQTNMLFDMLHWGRQLEHIAFSLDYPSNLTLEHLNELRNMPNLRSLELHFFSIPLPPAFNTPAQNIPAHLQRTRDADYAGILEAVAWQGRLEYVNTNLILSDEEALSIINHSPKLKAFYFIMREAETYLNERSLLPGNIPDRRKHVRIRHATRFNFIRFVKGLEQLWAAKCWDIQNRKLKMCSNPHNIWWGAPVDITIDEEMPPVNSEFIDYQYQPTESHVTLEVAARNLTEKPKMFMDILDLVMFEERQKLHDRRANRD